MIEYTNIGDFIDKNKIIFKYVYDKFGFKVGIVVAKKGEGRWHPRIGWALFKEVPHKIVVHTKSDQIPEYRGMGDFSFIPVEEVVISKGDKIDLFDKALNRTNYNSFSYYINFYDLDVHSDTILRSELPEIWYKDGNSDMEDSICYVDDYYGIIKSLKKAIKDLEFRSYRYFKK